MPFQQITKGLKTLYHFLGSVSCAIILVIISACWVTVGTFIESHSDSHRLAAQYTFDHPAFLAILCGFFINILFATLRRWPFGRHHIPFIITHIGLLTILVGTMVKALWGIQGNMLIMEGSESQEVLLDNSYVIQVQTRSSNPFSPPITQSFTLSPSLKPGPVSTHNPQLPDIQLVSSQEHAVEHMHMWIKEKHAKIFDAPPIPVQELSVADPFILPSPVQSKLPSFPDQESSLFAFRSQNPQDTLEQFLISFCKLNFYNLVTGNCGKVFH